MWFIIIQLFHYLQEFQLHELTILFQKKSFRNGKKIIKIVLGIYFSRLQLYEYI